MNIKPIKTEEDYEIALKRAEELMDSLPDTQEGDEFEVLVTLIENYEAKHYKIEAPDPVEAIKFAMEQNGINQKDLTDIIGSASKVSEVLNYKRGLSLNMIRNLYEKLHLPVELLVKRYDLKVG